MRPFPVPLCDAVLLRRYKRFLADVRMGDGEIRTVHVENPGAMTGLAEPGARVLLSRSENPRRKLDFSWELVRVGRVWACVNTAVANRVVRHWLENGRLDLGRGEIQPEPRYEDSRFDFRIGESTFVEVKSVTLATGRTAAFPDAVTLRGRRHLERLAAMKGARRVLVYFVARSDVDVVRPAEEIDPGYAEALRTAVAAGVELRAVGARFSRRGVAWRGDLAIRLH
ncbi:MAG: DNA/RNA nuclease SfsA [Planctomycetota bacterium]